MYLVYDLESRFKLYSIMKNLSNYTNIMTLELFATKMPHLDLSDMINLVSIVINEEEHNCKQYTFYKSIEVTPNKNNYIFLYDGNKYAIYNPNSEEQSKYSNEFYYIE